MHQSYNVPPAEPSPQYRQTHADKPRTTAASLRPPVAQSQSHRNRAPASPDTAATPPGQTARPPPTSSSVPPPTPATPRGFLPAARTRETHLPLPDRKP